MREPSASDIIIQTSVGDFRFARRTVGDSLRIRALFNQFAQNTDDVELAGYANVVSKISVLMVSSPTGWEDPFKIDLVENERAFDILFEVDQALRDKESSFRTGTKGKGAAGGAGTIGDAAVLVPSKVSANAE